MSKTAAIFLSSPRKGSNSSILAVAMGEGVSAAGGTVEVVDLARLDIKPCLACEACTNNGGKCVQRDGMKMVYSQVINADIIILATPVYWFNMSGQLKVFLDRCFATMFSEGNPMAKKTFAVAMSQGGSDPWESGGVNALRSIQDMCRYTGATWGGSIYGTAQERNIISTNNDLLEKSRQLGASLVKV